MSLPGELRNKIYEFAIGGNEVVFVHYEDTDTYTTKASPCNSDVKCTKSAWDRIFYLGRTCRQIHQETKLLPFRLNRFVVSVSDHNGPFLKSNGPFLKSLVPWKKHSITTIAFMSGTWYHSDDDSILRELDAYQGLTTIISTDMLDSPDWACVEEFAKKKGCKHVVEYEEFNAR